VTPPFLGAVAWELLAAPNSGLLNQLYRFVAGAESDEHLFNIYSMTGIIFVISCYTFPFVFVLVANALDNMPGELEDASAILGGKAWTTARRVTIPLALPALVAGALIAFLQAMTLFGSPAILALPAGFHTMTTKIWSLFQYPPKLELAAAAAVPLLLLTGGDDRINPPSTVARIAALYEGRATNEVLDGMGVAGFCGADKAVNAEAQIFPKFAILRRHAIDEINWRFVVILRRALDFLAMLVGAGDEGDVGGAQLAALKACERVGREHFVSVTDMRRAIAVDDCRSDVDAGVHQLNCM